MPATLKEKTQQRSWLAVMVVLTLIGLIAELSAFVSDVAIAGCVLSLEGVTRH
jgi:hypothetical protein